MAYKLIDAAKSAGADAVKFQTFKAENLATRKAPKADYQIETTEKSESQFQMLKSLELSREEYIKLKKYCEYCKIEFISTPFDIESIHFLNELVHFWKIPSGEITNYPYLIEIAKTMKPVILSTGMSNICEINEALSVLQGNGTEKVVLLHCNTQYPTPFEDVNLNAMNLMRKKFGVEVGYSDHSLGIEVPIAAVAMGATVIEKHFTLDKHMDGPDHKASLEPDELKKMVNGIRNVEKALGNEKKNPSPSETGNIAVVRKSIVAAKRIKKGEIFSEENLTTKRPGNGVSPMQWPKILGRVALHDYEEDDLIEAY